MRVDVFDTVETGKLDTDGLSEFSFTICSGFDTTATAQRKERPMIRLMNMVHASYSIEGLDFLRAMAQNTKH